MSALVRWKPGTPLVSLPELGPAPPPLPALETLQRIATKDGITIRLPNGYTVTPEEKKTRARRAKRKHFFLGEP